MVIDQKFIEDARKTWSQMEEKDLLPPIGHWMWLEPDKVKLYHWKRGVEFMTATETLQFFCSCGYHLLDGGYKETA